MNILDKIKSDLDGLLSDTPPADIRALTKMEFLQYALDQIELAKGESAEDRKPRVQHLMVNVDTLAKAGGFEDTGAKSIPVYSGPLSVQAQTAWKEQSERTIGMSAALGAQAPGPKGSFTSKSDGGPKLISGKDLMAALGALLGEEPESTEKSDDETAEASTEETTEETSEETTEDGSEGEEEAAAAPLPEGFEEEATAEAGAEGDEEITKSAPKDPWSDISTYDVVDDDPDLVFETGLRVF